MGLSRRLTLSRAVTILVAAALVHAPAAAQQTRGTITGVVRDAGSRQPVPAAQVFIPGTGFGGQTTAEGRYTLPNLPPGTYSVQVRRIGFRAAEQRIAITAGQTANFDFELSPTALTLDELVVTGAGVATERGRLGNTVGTITAEALENAPVVTFSEVLQGREPGVQLLPSGGLTGEGARIRIRGTNSLSQSNEPIVYLNGVRIDNAGGRGLVGTGGGGMPSRLDDIDPASIERVEILKGAAAATLYGSEASGGVIQIFTKQGAAGEARWVFELEQGASTYPRRAIPPNAGFVTSQAEADRLNTWWGTNIQPYRVFERDFVTDLFETGRSTMFSGTVGGGAPQLTYFASGRYHTEDGPIGNLDGVAKGEDAGTRASGTLSLSAFPREDVLLRLTTLYSDSRSSTINNNNNIYAPVTLAMFGQPQLAKCSTPGGSSEPIPGTGRCTGVGNPRGQAAFATVAEAFQRIVEQEARHFNGSIYGRYMPVPRLAVDATLGVDLVNQADVSFLPFGHNIDRFTLNDIAGYRLISNRVHRELSLDTKTNWDADLTPRLTSQLVVGAQGFLRRTSRTGGQGIGFPGPGFSVAEAGQTQTLNEFALSVVNAGLFVQEQLGWSDFAFLTLGARYDYSSAFGEAAGGALYPKISLSVVPTRVGDWSPAVLSTLRLRAALGQSGQQPGAFDKLTTYGSIRSPTYGAGVLPANLGNPDLRPEVATEWELGGEIGLWRDRAALEVTYWDRTVRDALIARQFPVTGGFRARQLANIGRLDAHGWEIGLRGTAYTGRSVQVDLFANGAFLRENITSLGGAPPLKVGESYPRYRNWLREGYAPGAFFGPIIRQVDYPIDISGNCQPNTRDELLSYFAQPRIVSAFAVLLEGGDHRPCSQEKNQLMQYLGKPMPDWQGGFGGSIALLNAFEITTLFEYKAGDFWVHNLTDGFRRAHLALGGNLRRPTEVRAILADPSSTAEQRLDAALEWARQHAALTPYDGLNEIERADFVRWRELSLTYNVPPRFTARMAGARSMAVRLSGRNIALWTRYSGIDPESNVFGRAEGPGLAANFGHGIDAFGLPLAQRYSLAVRVGF